MHKFPNKTAEYAECIKRLHEREIGVMGTFIVGFDEDTPEVFDQIVDFVIENRLETAFTLILTPKPDTMLFNQMKTQNRIFSHNWCDYDEGTVTFIPKNMTPRQLHSGHAIGMESRLFMAGNMAQDYDQTQGAAFLLPTDEPGIP